MGKLMENKGHFRKLFKCRFILVLLIFILAVYCHPAYLTYTQNTSCKMPGGMKHKLEPRLLGEISIT